MGQTNIEWTDRTWNFLRGCSRVSEGCRNCYAERQAVRFKNPGAPYHGLVESTPKGPRWTGKVEFFEHVLLDALKWKTPSRVFVNSMSDLFHESVQDEWLDKAFAVMALTPQHTYQILTKRPERMLEYFGNGHDQWPFLRFAAADETAVVSSTEMWLINGLNGWAARYGGDGPLPNVWLGVSVEDQKTADQRIPELLETPAAVRFVSYEPALGPIDFQWLKATLRRSNAIDALFGKRFDAGEKDENGHWMYDGAVTECNALDWVIVGGESGPRARPCDIAAMGSIVEQCKAAGVPVFVKQLGARPFTQGFVDSRGNDDRLYLKLQNRKGGDMAEWPEDLRVRQMPEVQHG